MTGGEHRDDTERLDPTADPRAEEATTTLHEERMVAGTELHDAGSVHVRKHVSTYPVEEVVPRNVEHADTSERTAPTEDDDGEVWTLPDGSVSIPVFEEVLVVTKKLVVRERVVVRKTTVVDEHTLRTELRREHVSVDADDAVTDRVTDRTRVGQQDPQDPQHRTP
jgi:uncharacterized protein (TIGR02271 family)